MVTWVKSRYLLIIFVFPGLPCIIVQTFDHFRHLYLSGNGPVASVQVDRAGCLTAETTVVSQSNLPKPRQTRKRAGAAPASASTGTSERAVTADASHISTTGVADIVKAVMSEMEPLFEKTIKAAVATTIEAMLPQLEASIAAENDRLTKEVGHLRSALQSQAFELDRLAQYSQGGECSTTWCSGNCRWEHQWRGDRHRKRHGCAYRRAWHLRQPPPAEIPLDAGTPYHREVCASRQEDRDYAIAKEEDAPHHRQPP